MKRSFLIRPIPALLLPVLLGCGGGSTPAPEPPKEKAATPPPVTKLETPPPPPKIPDAPSAPTTSAPPLPPKPGTAPQPAPKELTEKPPAGSMPTPEPPPKKSGKQDEFDPDVVGGKPIGKYVQQLDSANKDDVIEALEALKQVPVKAKKYADKITELTKNKDKEIADEAADTLKVIGK
jgi:hypothetical protein